MNIYLGHDHIAHEINAFFRCHGDDVAVLLQYIKLSLYAAIIRAFNAGDTHKEKLVGTNADGTSGF